MNKLFNFVHKRIFYSSPSPYSLQQEQFFKEKFSFTKKFKSNI
jgi:hypothetical protein